MSFRDDFYKELGESGVLNQTQDQKEMIEGVLFDIWMKGQLERTGLASFCVIIISNVVGFFLAIISLPRVFMRLIPSVIFSLIIAAIVYAAWLSLESSVAAFWIAFAFLNRGRMIKFIRNFTYDIADAALLGMLTRRRIKFIQSVGPIKRFKGDDFLAHLFVSRILSSGDYCYESDAFQEMVRRYKDDWKAFEELISIYWLDGRGDRHYWRNKLIEAR